ncbi:MAG: multiple sugar transport system ATP-binding protein [Chloroflexota bacterium]|nr:multiple sugar transport system ATP-binding protein [Chloroflexota bacterium]
MVADVKFEGVHKLFGAETAVEDLNLTVEAGEFMVLVGPSGCGKTTTLRMLAGLERPSYGRILIGDRVVNNIAPRFRDIAMVFQSYALYPHMNVYDNLAFGMRARGESGAVVDSRVKETAEVLGLGQLLKRRPSQLSGGQRQRVALGRALIRQPQVFLMDEPLSNLDAGLRVQMRAELSRLHQRFRVTTIYVTHDQVEAMTMGDRIAVMDHGRLQQVDTPETLYDSPANVFVAGFIGSPRMNFLPGRLTSTGGSTVVEFLGVTTPLSANSRLISNSTDGEVQVGIRPEDLSWRAAAGPDSTVTLRAEVDVVEPMGHEAYVTALCGGHTVISRFPPRSGVRTREEVELALNPARLHLFDARSGDSILERPVEGGAAVRSTEAAWITTESEQRPDRQRPATAPGVPTKSQEDLIQGGTA